MVFEDRTPYGAEGSVSVIESDDHGGRGQFPFTVQMVQDIGKRDAGEALSREQPHLALEVSFGDVVRRVLGHRRLAEVVIHEDRHWRISHFEDRRDHAGACRGTGAPSTGVVWARVSCACSHCSSIIRTQIMTP